MAETPAQSSSQAPQRRKGRRLAVLGLACLILSALFRSVTQMDSEAVQYRVHETTSVVGGQWLAGMLLGFRQAVADLMWIRVDQYFHEGRYDKIMPLCYIITTMDPSWIDVYTTGAWHMGYNFGDRRLVPAAVAFDQRGVDNNPKNSDMRYELGWMEMTRGYQFAAAANAFRQANQLGLRPVGKRHAYPHALEAAGDVKGAIAAWAELEREDPKDPVPPKWITLLGMRKDARKDLGKKPILAHMDVKITREGNRVLDIDGVTNLPKFTKIFYDLRDSDWRERVQKSLNWQMEHYTLYSQTDTTLQPSMGIFQGQEFDFYKGVEHQHQDDKQYDQFPTEPVMQVVNGHMQCGNGYFHGTIDMAKTADQYPLESKTYELRLFVDPRMEPITTQDIIGWNGEGLAGPLVQKIDGYNQLVWTMTLTLQDIDPTLKR
jgi:hypothetical protein